MNRTHVNFIRYKVKKKKPMKIVKPKKTSNFVSASSTKKIEFSLRRVTLAVGLGIITGTAGLMVWNMDLNIGSSIETVRGPVSSVSESQNHSAHAVAPVPVAVEVEPMTTESVASAPVVEVIQEKNQIMTWEEVSMLNDLQSKNIQGVQSLKKGEKGDVSLVLNTDQFFMVGTAKIASEKVPQLSEIAGALKATAKELGDRVALEIEGHTDDSPIVKQKHLYQSNWELSAARAASLVHLFEEAGFDKEKMKLVGYGDSRPMVPNRDPNGEPITGNAVKNRRIVLRVYPADPGRGSL